MDEPMTRKVITTEAPPPAEQLKKMSQHVLACRSIGHNWTIRDTNSMFEVHDRNPRTHKVAQVSRTLVCACCTMKRVDVYDYPSFNLVRHAYERPAGYDVVGGRAWRHDANYELFSRQGVK
jgi:hypothetical protein